MPMMIDMDDPAHVRRRKLVNKGFTPQRVRDQEALAVRVTDQLIDRVCEQGQCDLVWDVAAWLPLVMIAEALGFDEADRPSCCRGPTTCCASLGQTDLAGLERAGDAFAGYTAYMTERDRRPPGGARAPTSRASSSTPRSTATGSTRTSS